MLRVRCVRNNGQQHALTVGKVYEAEESIPGGYYYTITNDCGLSGAYYGKTRFEIVNEKEEQTMKVRCIDDTGIKAHITKGKVYDAVLAGGHQHFRLKNNKGDNTLYTAKRFEIIPEEPEEPKMGAIYLICVVEAGGLKANLNDPIDTAYSTYTEHTLDGAKAKLEKLNQELLDDEAHEVTAGIFELHSYYENRPFFVEVKR